MHEYLSDRDIFIFGAGSLSKRLVDQFHDVLDSLNLIGVVDNHPALAGTLFFQKKVYTPEILQQQQKDRVYILVASSFYEEICDQLRKLGFEEGRHFDDAIRVLAPIKYRGDRVFCVCCGNTFDRFMPFGDPVRLNAQCPFCLSLERQRLIWTYLKSNLNRNSDRPVKLLHVAPEPALTRLITERKGIEYLSIDIDSKKAMMAMDLTDLSFDDDSYDIIICSHVLEHIDDDRKALQELYRVLKAGGYAILQVPIDKNRAVTYENREITAPEERKKHFGQADHVRQYGLDFGERLEQAGFTVKIVTASEFTDNPERYGFNEDGLYVCYKKANERK